MKYTNKHNLPASMVEAITKDDYDGKKGPNSISVTRLIDSPLIKRLLDLHCEEIEEDVSEGIWRLLGHAVHSVMEKVSKKGRKIEKRFKEKVDGILLTGKPDIYDEKEKAIIDYKITSVWSIVFADSKSWEKQLNVYAYLMTGAGNKVEKLQVMAVLRDWNAREAEKNETYPKIPFAVINVRLWTTKEQEDYIFERIKIHKAARTEYPELLNCLPEERWSKPTTWAVYALNKNGTRKERATRVFDTKEKAAEFCGTNMDASYEMVERPGEDSRCTRYCAVNRWCAYYKQINGGVI